MKIQQLQYFDKAWKVYMHSDGFDRMQCQLVLAFGEASLVTELSVFNYLERSYPKAHILLCSTSGEIMHNDVFDNSVVVTAVEFSHATVFCAETNINDHKNSYEAGEYLMQQLRQSHLSAAFIISDGTYIKGSDVMVLNALRKEKHISHFSLEESIEVAKELEIPQTYITHISHQMGLHAEVEAELPNGINLAYDGLVITL